MLPLIGIAVVVVGFMARLNPLLVVTLAALVTGLAGGMGPVELSTVKIAAPAASVLAPICRKVARDFADRLIRVSLLPVPAARPTGIKEKSGSETCHDPSPLEAHRGELLGASPR